MGKLTKIVLALFILCASPAWATSVTVCDSGCNYTTIAAALTAVGNGTHTVTLTGTYTAAENITVANSGTDANNRLTIIGSAKQTVKRFLITGNYVTIDNLKFDGLTGSARYISLSDGVQYITIQNCLFSHSTDGVLNTAGLSTSTGTPANVKWTNFEYIISATTYSKAADATGIAPGNDVIPSGKFGAVAFEIDAGGTVDAIEATNNATGYDSAALAAAGLPAVQASHIRMGYLTVSQSDGNFTLGTSALNGATVTEAYTNQGNYCASIASFDGTGLFSDPRPSNILVTLNEFVYQPYHMWVYGDSYTVSHNTFHDNVGGSDVMYVGGDGVTISDNEIYNISEVGSNHADFIQTAGSIFSISKNVIVERNYVHDLDGAQWCNLSKDNVANISDWTFRNNIFANTLYSGNIGIPNVTIVNNTFYKVSTTETGSQYAFQLMDTTDGVWDATGAVVKNNIFINKTANNTGWYVVDADLAAEEYTIDYNYVADEDDYGAKTGFSETHGVNGGNPYLSNVAAGTAAGFALTENSTILIGVGEVLNASFTTDYAGTDRGAAWDIGAYEYEAGGDPPSYPTIKLGTGAGFKLGTGAGFKIE